MDAMSEAIEGAEVVLFGVSLKYKESGNVSREQVSCLHEQLRLTAFAISVVSKRTTPIRWRWQ